MTLHRNFNVSSNKLDLKSCVYSSWNWLTPLRPPVHIASSQAFGLPLSDVILRYMCQRQSLNSHKKSSSIHCLDHKLELATNHAVRIPYIFIFYGDSIDPDPQLYQVILSYKLAIDSNSNHEVCATYYMKLINNPPSHFTPFLVHVAMLQIISAGECH